MSFDQTANLLGALALVVSDRTTDAMELSAGASPSRAAALSAMHHFLETPSIDLLRRVLGLTSSGTVRLVDGLEGDGLVRREPGVDGRTTAIVLTAAGRRAAKRIADARAGAIERCLESLDATERETLGRLAGKILSGAVRPLGATRWICRLCDTAICGRDVGRCPVANAALGGPSPITTRAQRSADRHG